MKHIQIIALILLGLVYWSGYSTAQSSFNLQKELDAVKNEYSIPGMSAAVVIDGAITDKAVSGVRKKGAPNVVQMNDPFMLCSVTKPVTATLAFMLAEKNILPMHTKILDVFPELSSIARKEYREVTVEMLLTHRACFPYMPKTEKQDEFYSISQDMMKRRYEYVKAALIDKPDCTPGDKVVYSGGTIIAAAMMEKKTGKLWETLVREYIFHPLGLSSAGFGAMSRPDTVSGAWEHAMAKDAVEPVPWPQRYDTEVHAPAGRNVYMSASDLAKFMISSFPYIQKGVKLLSRRSLIAMQQMSGDGPSTPGWFSGFEEWSDWKTVFHFGDNGKSMSALIFSPKLGSGMVVMANLSSKETTNGITKLSEKIKAYIKQEAVRRKLDPRMTVASQALSYQKSVIASNYYKNIPEYGPAAALDGRLLTRWATDDGVKEAWIEIDLGKEQVIRSILIKEEFFPRVTSFEITGRSHDQEKYHSIYSGTLIGDEFVAAVPQTKVRFIRLTVRAAKTFGPTISEFQVFGNEIKQ